MQQQVGNQAVQSVLQRQGNNSGKSEEPPLAELKPPPTAVGQVTRMQSLGKGGLKWSRNFASAVHPLAHKRKAIKKFEQGILNIDCVSGLSNVRSQWNVRFDWNQEDITTAEVNLVSSSTWKGGLFGSTANISFEMKNASDTHGTPGDVAAIMLTIKGRLDPAGSGDIEFEGQVLLLADGTTKRMGDLKITRGNKKAFTIQPLGAGWLITKGKGLPELPPVPPATENLPDLPPVPKG